MYVHVLLDWVRVVGGNKSYINRKCMYLIHVTANRNPNYIRLHLLFINKDLIATIMDGNVRSNICLPKVNSVEDGRVCRIESYGAFVQLQDIRYSHRGRPVMGLVHISELCEGRVNSVEDVCSLDMDVKVRVLEVTEDDGGRSRIKLSMKGLNGDKSVSRRTAASVAVLGMGSAGSALVDPLVAMRQSVSTSKSNLVLKNRDGNSEEMLFNGYALVDDTAGEPDHEALSLLNNRNGSNKNKVNGDRRSSSLATTEPSTIGRGRGRGRTLPAWMTSGSSSNNVNDNLPSRAVRGDNTPGDNGSSTNSSLSTRSKKRKRRKRHESKSHRKRSKKGSSSRSSRYRHKKEKSAKRCHRTRSRYRYDTDSSSGNDHGYHRSRGSTKEVDRKFSSVNEAKDLIRRLESGGS